MEAKDKTERFILAYAAARDTAVVVFGERELKYLRPNIKIAYPKEMTESNYNESWDEFLFNLENTSPIFVETRKQSKKYNLYHESVGIVIKALPQNKVLQIKKSLKK